MNSLRTENLSKIYTAGIDVAALDHVDFSVEEGELVAIIGDSGSGKSTLLHLLAGIDQPTEGTVYIQGENMKALTEEERTVFRRRNIGVIYQFFNLLPTINVKKNILLPLLLDGRREDKDYFHEIISVLGIGDKLDRYPDELSGGEQQRVAIARSLVTRPAIILADEPTGNLDRRNSEEIIALFRRVNQRFNATMIVVTHDEKVANACDKVFRMSDGHLAPTEVSL